jgi:hypothetical protein
MDVCLFTTTINCPTVLRQYRQSDPDVHFIVAGDNKTPHAEVRALCKELGNAVYLDMAQQENLGYKCHDIIGPNTIQRRNIALLEAIRSGADVVVSIDDDNAPRRATYFEDLRTALEPRGHPVAIGSEWFNLGDYAESPYIYRGFPFSLRDHELPTFTLPRAVQVGIVNGLIYGDPDINAIDRYRDAPRVRAYSGYAEQYGVAVNPRTTWTPVNSQNTAYVRELAPLAFVLPAIGRYDDIWASFMALRVMEATDYHVLFGEPSVIQERNPHNWLVDLEREIYGMRHTEAFCEGLKAISVDPAKSVLDNLDAVRQGVTHLPLQARLFMDAWMDDVAKVI